MCLAVAGIDHQPLEIWVDDEPLQQCLPYALVAPTTKTPMGVFPITIGRWQIAPGGPGSQNPQDGINEAPIVLGYATPLASLPGKMRFEQRPVSIGKIMPSKGFGRSFGQWGPQWLPLHHIS
jgi:hypothetical protein